MASRSRASSRPRLLREGTTENATVCKALLADLRERGLDLDRPTLFIIDGGTGLRKAIRETSGALGLVQRCQVHKARNVLEHLPEAMRPRVRRALNEAYGLADATLAKRRLTQLAAGLERTHPGAAASLREGLDETLTLQELTSFLTERGLAKFKLPERLELADDLPLSKFGKVAKNVLTKQVAEKIQA